MLRLLLRLLLFLAGLLLRERLLLADLLLLRDRLLLLLADLRHTCQSSRKSVASFVDLAKGPRFQAYMTSMKGVL